MRAARLHFEFGLTHEQAAATLGLSRVKVTRLLKQARDCGLVKITVTSDLGIFTDVEDQLTAGGRLNHAIVVPGSPSSGELRIRLAKAAARYLQQVLRDEMVVAMGLSRTIALVADHLSDPKPVRARFVSMVGALREGGAGTGSPYESTQALATAFGGSAGHLHAPVAVKSAEMARQLMQDPSIATTLRQAGAADMSFVGIGGAKDRIDLTDAGYLTPRDMRELLASGSVGDIGGRFFDATGRAVTSSVDRRMIGLTLAQFCKIPNRVITAGGDDKVGAIAAAVRGGLASVLITDVTTGRAVIDDLARDTTGRTGSRPHSGEGVTHRAASR